VSLSRISFLFLECPDMKVLFISGYTKDIIVERGILEDEFSVITKPVTSHELLKKMREILDWNRF
jgi:two-component system, cell cycle sensor histidine kinase and response regulator CckA